MSFCIDTDSAISDNHGHSGDSGVWQGLYVVLYCQLRRSNYAGWISFALYSITNQTKSSHKESESGQMQSQTTKYFSEQEHNQVLFWYNLHLLNGIMVYLEFHPVVGYHPPKLTRPRPKHVISYSSARWMVRRIENYDGTSTHASSKTKPAGQYREFMWQTGWSTAWVLQVTPMNLTLWVGLAIETSSKDSQNAWLNRAQSIAH